MGTFIFACQFSGKLCSETALFVIGGGYDLGLINSLGAAGMGNIKRYVQSGGSYLGICSGAYFACDRIEFDKDGPLEVVGDRFLKFFPGIMCLMLYFFSEVVFSIHLGNFLL